MYFLTNCGFSLAFPSRLVEFSDAADAFAAIEQLNGSELQGRAIVVREVGWALQFISLHGVSIGVDTHPASRLVLVYGTGSWDRWWRGCSCRPWGTFWGSRCYSFRSTALRQECKFPCILFMNCSEVLTHAACVRRHLFFSVMYSPSSSSPQLSWGTTTMDLEGVFRQYGMCLGLPSFPCFGIVHQLMAHSCLISASFMDPAGHTPGSVERAEVVMSNGRSRGFGTVLFATPDDAQEGISECGRLWHMNAPMFMWQIVAHKCTHVLMLLTSILLHHLCCQAT